MRNLTEKESRIVLEVLLAAARGPFFPDWEFKTLFGLQRPEVAAIAERWPEIDDSDETVVLGINNAFANLLGYPHGHEEAWSRFISVDSDEVKRVFDKWRGRTRESR